MGIRVKDAVVPVVAVGNLFLSERQHTGVSITGARGDVSGNRVEKPGKKE
jgi:hypothetical protein